MVANMYSYNICSHACIDLWYPADEPFASYRFAVCIVTYFVVGALIMKFHYQATGTDIIPNKNLWIQFPLVVKVRTFMHSCNDFIHS